MHSGVNRQTIGQCVAAALQHCTQALFTKRAEAAAAAAAVGESASSHSSGRARTRTCVYVSTCAHVLCERAHLPAVLAHALSPSVTRALSHALLLPACAHCLRSPTALSVFVACHRLRSLPLLTACALCLRCLPALSAFAACHCLRSLPLLSVCLLSRALPACRLHSRQRRRHHHHHHHDHLDHLRARVCVCALRSARCEASASASTAARCHCALPQLNFSFLNRFFVDFLGQHCWLKSHLAAPRRASVRFVRCKRLVCR